MSIMSKVILLSFLLCISQDRWRTVEGAKCSTTVCLKSSGCGKGAECGVLNCSWCNGWCHKSKSKLKNRGKRETGPEYGEQKMAYKIPYIEMTQDLIQRIQTNTISHSHVIKFFEDVSERCKRDIDICEDHHELKEFSDLAKTKSRQLRSSLFFHSPRLWWHFYSYALLSARELLNFIMTLTEDIIISIDRTSSIFDGVPGILIAGGNGSSAEVWSRNGDSITSCYIPSLPTPRVEGSINGKKFCGGYGGSKDFPSLSTCVEFKDGKWIYSNTKLNPKRDRHASWETRNGIYLIGGSHSDTTSTLVKADGTSTDGFSLHKKIYMACAIPDEDTVVITGGVYTQKEVSRYNENGFLEYLPSLISHKEAHHCSWFINEQRKRVYIVRGGDDHFGTSSVELLVKGDDSWRQTNNIPSTMYGAALVNVYNKIYLAGDWEEETHTSPVFEFDTKMETWTKVGNGRDIRYGAGAAGVSMIKFGDIKKYVFKCHHTIQKSAGKITYGSVIQTIDELSPFYTLKTKVKVNKYTSNYAALWHFTIGPNGGVMGSRIPGIFIWPNPYNLLQISFQVGNNEDYYHQWKFQLNTWYEIELSQTKEGNNGRIKLLINGVERRNVLNTSPRSFTGVKVYQGSPNSYTDGVGNPATPDIDYEYFYYENGM